uniref:Uncharacterized protein n=1 Tax=Ciona savignyi TaxID=51511 RepID=H2YWH1_CIOSA
MDKEQPTPDVVFVNSCLWDISRYGRNSKKEYINNLEKFCTELDKCVPIETCIVWRTTLPVSQRARGGFLSKEIANCTNTLVVDVLLANHLAHTIITRHKYDVVDMHFLFTQQQQRREKDGVHWNMFAHRRMTNIFLTHIAEAWGLGVPVPPSYNDADVIFDPRDISMNTTEVLQHAYTPENVHRPTAEEVRYGGPIRSPNEMFNLYSSFYNVPQEIHLHDAEVYNEYDDIANYMQQYSSEVYRQRTLNLHEHAVRASLTAPGQTIHSNNFVLHNNNFHSNNAAEWTRKVHYEENYMRPPKQARQKKFRLHPYRQLHR